MSKLPYTYRVELTSLDTEVEVEKYDPDNNELGQPTGKFNFDEVRRTAVTQLSQKAFTNDITATEIKELGNHLFRALFDPVLEKDFLDAYETAVHHENTQLRLELDINEAKMPDIAALPWEFMCVPENQVTGELWLATTPNVILSRRRSRWKAPKPITLTQDEKLRIAVVASTPNDEDLGIVAYKKLYEELQTLQQKMGAEVEITLLNPETDPATVDNIDRVLEKRPHIFHFIGHGRAQDKDGHEVNQIGIVKESGNVQWVSGKQFSGLFARYRPGIVLLQACEGGKLSAAQAFAGVGSQIVQHNIPVVLAMQYEISNASARRFAQEFYTRLANGDPVDKAAQEGRFKIRNFHESRNFATPVLFMRVRNGRLFTVPSVSPTPLDNPTPLVNPSSSNNPPKLSLAHRTLLKGNLQEYFSLSDLRMFCFDSGIDYQDFPAVKGDFITGLIQFLENNNRINELVAWGKAERDFLNWDAPNK